MAMKLLMQLLILIEKEKMEELLEKNGFYANLYNAQFELGGE